MIHDAGAASVGTVENDDLDPVRACLEVDFSGVVQVTRTALPHLRAAAG